MSFNNERIIHFFQIAIRIMVLPIMCLISYGTKSYVPIVLGICVLIVLLGISRIKLIGSRFQGSDVEKQTFKNIVIRSIILAPIITIVFIAIVVILTVNS